MEKLGLGLTGSQPSQPLVAPLSPIEPKNPGTAFLLSLILPGMGQVYSGAKRRGGLTFLFIAICFAALVLSFGGVVPGEAGELLGGIALRTGLALYVFAFLDAYFTAREFNDGTLYMKPYNTRLAAVLNLTTRGFGYWHLDEKKRGIIFFILVGLLDRASRKITGDAGTWLSIAVEVLLAGLAIDAYRLAVRKNNEALEKAPLVPISLQPDCGLNPRVPLALAGLLAFFYVGILTLGVTMPDYEKIDQATATISDNAGGKWYRNSKYGVELRVPAEWTVKNSDAEYIVETEAHEGACSLSLSADSLLPFQSAESFVDDVIQQTAIQAPQLKFREKTTGKLGHLNAHETVFVNDSEDSGVTLRYVIAKSGLSLFYLIITSSPHVEESCSADIAKIRQSIVLPK